MPSPPLLPRCGPLLNRHASGSRHDLRRLPDHSQESALKVEGVSKVDVGFEKREAVVTFDDTKASVQKLTKATADAGYPSSVKQ